MRTYRSNIVSLHEPNINKRWFVIVDSICCLYVYLSLRNAAFLVSAVTIELTTRLDGGIGHGGIADGGILRGRDKRET